MDYGLIGEKLGHSYSKNWLIIHMICVLSAKKNLKILWKKENLRLLM